MATTIQIAKKYSISPIDVHDFFTAALADQTNFTDVKEWARTYSRKFFHDVSRNPGFLPIYNTLVDMVTNPVESPTFDKNFPEQFKIAYQSIDKYKNRRIEDWAHNEMTRIYWVFNRQTRPKVIYDALVDSAKRMKKGLEPISYKDTTQRPTPLDKNTSTTNNMTEKNKSNTSNVISKDTTKDVFVEDNKQTDAEEKKGRYLLNKVLYSEFNKWYDAFVDEALEDSSEDAMNADERFCWHSAKILSRKTDIRAGQLYPIVQAWLDTHTEKVDMNQDE